MSLVARVLRAVEARAPGTPPRTRRGGARACLLVRGPSRSGRTERFLRTCAKIASRRRSQMVRVRTLDRRGPVGQMPRFGYMVYVNGCSSDRHLIYVDRHSGARAVVAGRRLQCSAGLMQRRRALAAASRCSAAGISAKLSQTHWRSRITAAGGELALRCDLDLASCKTLASPGLALQFQCGV